jgi:SAM-dependent methyltransferase
MQRISNLTRNTPALTHEYGTVASTTFSRIYPVIADQILARTGITKGTCLDVGSGAGHLAIAIALLSELRVTALDNAPAMLELAHRNIRNRCMEHLVVPAIGDVHAIPAANAAFDLVISRGSFHSWRNLPVALREIHRVLRPWGIAYIGGGYGSARLRDEIHASSPACMSAEETERGDHLPLPRIGMPEIQKSLEAAGIGDYRIIDDESGFWVVIRKSAGPGLQKPPSDAINAYRDNFPVYRNGFFFPR